MVQVYIHYWSGENIGHGIKFGKLAGEQEDCQIIFSQCRIHFQSTMVPGMRNEMRPFSSCTHSMEGDRKGLNGTALVFFAVFAKGPIS